MTTWAFWCVAAAQWASGSGLSSFPTVCVPWVPLVTSGKRYKRVPRSEVAGSLPVCQSRAGQCPEWSTKLSLWSPCGLTSLSLFLSLPGYVADAAIRGARRFCHRHRGGAQCTRVCGESLQTCGKDHCVSVHTQAQQRSLIVKHYVQNQSLREIIICPSISWIGSFFHGHVCNACCFGAILT